MINLRKKLILILLLFFLVPVLGCKISKEAKKSTQDIRTGTEGISMRFLPNYPPPLIHAESASNFFDATLELTNRGVYPQPDSLEKLDGSVYLSGFDKNIIGFTPEGAFELGRLNLQAKSAINAQGSSDVANFKGEIRLANLNVELYEPTLLATACYKYETLAGPSVCIDPNPYSTVKEKKVCEVNGITLSSQGAPIAITKIEEEAFAQEIQFKITIKNVGIGDVIKLDSIQKCNPFGTEKLGREDIDKVYVKEITIGQQGLTCWPFSDGLTKAPSGYIRLINGEGSVICRLTKGQGQSGYQGGNTAYTTPLKIVLSYAYKNTAETKFQIKKEMTSTSP